jgi:hypothetical protein
LGLVCQGALAAVWQSGQERRGLQIQGGRQPVRDSILLDMFGLSFHSILGTVLHIVNHNLLNESNLWIILNFFKFIKM